MLANANTKSFRKIDAFSEPPVEPTGGECLIPGPQFLVIYSFKFINEIINIDKIYC